MVVRGQHRHWHWMPPIILVAVGLATGAVRVSYTAWLLATSVLAWLAYGYWLRRAERERGPAVSERHRPHQWVMTLGMALALVLIPLLSASRPRPSFDHSPVVLWFNVPMITWMVWALIAQWPWGERWTGPLLVEITRPQTAGRRPLVWSTALLAVCASAALVVSLVYEPRIGTAQLMIAVTTISQVVSVERMTRRTAVHERGIVAHGEFIHWARIESYSWRPTSEASGDPIVELHLQRRARVHFPHRAIMAPQDRQHHVEAILSRKLSPQPRRVLLMSGPPRMPTLRNLRPDDRRH